MSTHLPTSPPPHSTPQQWEAQSKLKTETHHSGPTPVDDTPLLPPAPASFHPFFSLLTTHHQLPSSSPSGLPAISTTHHPHIHYLFASDPSPNALDDALLNPPGNPSQSNGDGNGTRQDGQNERYILIDLDSTGTKILNAQSLTPEWAITKAEVREAPTWGGGDGKGNEARRHRGHGGSRGNGAEDRDEVGESGDEEEDRKDMMLLFEGMERAENMGEGDDDVDGGEERKGGVDVSRCAGGEGKEVEDLVEEFGRGMEGLRRVVGAGEIWHRVEDR